jgi:hypothetical protein
MPSGTATRSSRGYFGRRWHGEIAARTLLTRDMLAIGSLVNLAVTFAALFLLSQGAHPALAAALHFSPAPYNVFLFASFWRAPQRTAVASAVAILWLALVTLV